ncbi:ABC transporter substrate-binding protein [Lentibacillus sp. CBA3610]|uniref:ABC transporter substrate-binding protein n=1 Tax=Lentibacillus sp. CBA3610 TaxID=2518176 RepID=UPI001595FBC7|nr:ABC transporter substrate-binding protein [Lentibacillus sp. CBA3610]QKY68288.1 hypothetical protein Len3610_00405 [Lentibacillus sp. CBA3610]
MSIVKKGLILFSFVFIVLIISGCNSENASSEGDTIKIGAVLPMTGGNAVFGEKFEQAYTMAAEEINEAGGVNGKEIEIVIEDSEGDAQNARSATEKLVSDDGILALTGGRSSGVTLVEAQVAEENQIPYLIDHGSSDLATMEGYTYVYRLNPTAGMYPNALLDYFNENPPESIAHINVDNAFGEAVYDYGLQGYVENSDVEYEMFEYTAGELDLKPIMEQAKGLNPEVVLMTSGNDNDAAQLMMAANEASLSPELFVGTGAGHSIMGFAEQAGDLSETVLTAGPWHGDKNDEEYQAFFDKFTETYGNEPGEHEIEGYTAIYVLADAFERAEELNRESVLSALDSTDLDTIFGPIKFEDFDGYTNQNRAITDVSQWINGKMVTVYPEDQAQQELVPFQGWD